MGKASSNKKVARAARTGGGRTSRGRTPWMWYSTMAIVVVVGVLLVGISRADLGSQASADPPVANKDHWHASIGFYLCDKYAPAPQDPPGKPDALGIHTHGDGLIHTHPFSKRAAGKKATLERFTEFVGIKLTRTRLKLQGDKKEYVDGETKCGKKVGRLRVLVWDKPSAEKPKQVAGDPVDVRLKQAEVIAIAFVPEGTDVPQPPSAATVNTPSDVGTAPPPGAPGSEPTGGPETPGATTAPATPDATTAPTTPGSPPSSAP